MFKVGETYKNKLGDEFLVLEVEDKITALKRSNIETFGRLYTFTLDGLVNADFHALI